MCAALGGRAAEEIIFGQVSTGALSDLEKITKQAYASIVYYGLNEKIGNVSYYDSSGQSEYSFSKPYSEHTAEMIDAEIKNMINEAYFSTKEILMNNKEKLTLLAEKLLEKEVIFRDDLETIFGKRLYETREQQLEQAEKSKELDKPKEIEETLVNEQIEPETPESSI
jgi:cell division protease FtsH